MAKIFCADCNIDITNGEYFICSLCGKKVCMGCQKKHVAKCMIDKWPSEYLPAERKKEKKEIGEKKSD